jgi:uroporphyrinogen-III synthase
VIKVAVTTERFDLRGPWFRQFGLEPVWLPCIRIESAGPDVLTEARQAAASADLLLISSVRTIELLWPDGVMPPVEVAVVGDRTAAAVSERGGRVVVVGNSGLANLSEVLADRLGQSKVAFPHAAESATSELAESGSGESESNRGGLESIRGRASNLREFEIYRTIPIPPDLDPVHGVAFASPSAVAGWLGSRGLEGLVIGVIGSTTAAAVAQYRPVDVIAPHPSHQALASAMASHLELSV